MSVVEGVIIHIRNNTFFILGLLVLEIRFFEIFKNDMGLQIKIMLWNDFVPENYSLLESLLIKYFLNKV